jgi:hypothetical protein
MIWPQENGKQRDRAVPPRPGGKVCVSMPSVMRAAFRPKAITVLIALAVAGFCGGLPAAQAAGRALHTTGTVYLSTGSNSISYDFTEAPDGAVYYSRGSKVYVVQGTSAPALVVQAGGTVLALAANSSELFVDVGRTVTAYRLPGGAKGPHWTLSSPFAITSAGLYAVGSTIWAWTDWATDESGLEYANVSRFTASLATVRGVSAGVAYPMYLAADSSGLYYQAVRGNGTNGYLVRVTPSGSSLRLTDTNIDGPLALAGGRVELLVLHDSSGKVNLYLDSYDATSLAHVFSRPVPGDDLDIAGTGAGLLVLAASCKSLSCSSATVSQLSTATGAAASTLTVPYGLDLVAGPSAVVITYRNGKYYLVRLAG